MVINGAWMEPDDEQAADRALDQHIFALLQLHRRLTFAALAELLPEYSWRSLFSGLTRLHHEGRIALLPVEGSYEIVFVCRRSYDRSLHAAPIRRTPV